MFEESHLGHLKLFWPSEFEEVVELGLAEDDGDGDAAGEAVGVPSRMVPPWMEENLFSPPPTISPALPPNSS